MPDEIRRIQQIAAVSKVTWVGLVINVLLALIKIVAGILGNSRAVTADGIHSLSDLLTDVSLLIGVRIWTAPPDDAHPYGHQRYETLLTAGIGILLAVVAIGIVVDASVAYSEQRLHHAKYVALWAALLSIVVKEVLYRWTAYYGRLHKAPSVIANAWHHRSDALSSIPAAASVLVALAFPNLYWVDLVGSIIVAFFIIHAAWEVAMPAVNELVDKGVSTETVEDLKKLAESVDGVLDVHKVRTRYQGVAVFVDLHVAVDGSISVEEGHAIADRVETLLMNSEYDVADALVHVDPYIPERRVRQQRRMRKRGTV
ncbi:cation diffusion facilitator family transporter [Halodesulfovibrio marinisediminis]|uniref:Cation diffusion facilitator family transporter n=1 Tax=Halodesulfovibrio marinisediminis DSM 17456 TaxID=1121457 RepID=A0A1N6DCK6_9BACT|nr:cation diffusion facilitator family transporter [Halodesulfovibrio marinisediminis]SIN68519.1 cation diffusion facilitator family transporter [Halodesulfovibrio marinisediminis DSM 17456]